MPRPRSTRNVRRRKSCYRIDKPPASTKTRPRGNARPLEGVFTHTGRNCASSIPSGRQPWSARPALGGEVGPRGAGSRSRSGRKRGAGGPGCQKVLRETPRHGKVIASSLRVQTNGRHAVSIEPPARHCEFRGPGVLDKDAPRIATRCSPRARGSITRPPREPRPCHAGPHLQFPRAWRRHSASRPSRPTFASRARACRRRLLFVSRGERPRALSPEL
jgi:hypothetical protein